MCKEQMMKYIQDSIEDADENTLEQLYWFLVLEIGK